MAKFIATNDPSKVDASPTKAFFVDIITTDVELDEAIEDLVDNSVDGAKRLATHDDFKGLTVSITCNSNEFKIADNCGGIPLEIARNYAFKFGRAEGFEKTKHSVGQFGIGMKRALFKIGDAFKVQTVEKSSSYTIDVDVSAWVADKENWDFDITDLTEKSFKSADTGTTISIDELSDEAKADFSDEEFLSRLRSSIRVSQQDPINRGLEIIFNGEAIVAPKWKLLRGSGITPGRFTFADTIEGSVLHTRIFVGISDPSRDYAGWYIFCNGRNILEADQSRKTGWNESHDGVKIPRYHGQFARFRGYAFLDSDESSILPWNTTKTDLAPEAISYRALKPRLIAATRPVIDFLNKLDAEFDFLKEDRDLEQLVRKATSVPLERIVLDSPFQFVEPPKKGPPMSTISFKKPRVDAFELRDETGSTSLRTLGEFCFDYVRGDLLGD